MFQAQVAALPVCSLSGNEPLHGKSWAISLHLSLCMTRLLKWLGYVSLESMLWGGQLWSLTVPLWMCGCSIVDQLGVPLWNSRS